MDHQCVQYRLLIFPHVLTLKLSIANVSVCTFPIEVLPHFYRYGYAMPFYNVSRAMRSIVFGTKNRGVLSNGHLSRIAIDSARCSRVLFRYTHCMGCDLMYHPPPHSMVCTETTTITTYDLSRKNATRRRLCQEGRRMNTYSPPGTTGSMPQGNPHTT